MARLRSPTELETHARVDGKRQGLSDADERRQPEEECDAAVYRQQRQGDTGDDHAHGYGAEMSYPIADASSHGAKRQVNGLPEQRRRCRPRQH